MVKKDPIKEKNVAKCSYMEKTLNSNKTANHITIFLDFLSGGQALTIALPPAGTHEGGGGYGK